MYFIHKHTHIYTHTTTHNTSPTLTPTHTYTHIYITPLTKITSIGREQMLPPPPLDARGQRGGVVVLLHGGEAFGWEGRRDGWGSWGQGVSHLMNDDYDERMLV